MKKTAHDLLDDMRYSTVKLTVERNEGEETFGTGFFFNPGSDDTTMLLVTNQHVIENWKSVTFRANIADEKYKPVLGNTQVVRIENTQDRIVIEHPEEDLVAFMIWPQLRRLQAQGIRLGIRFMTPKHIPTELETSLISPVEDILMTGYPDGMADEKNNLPIVRKGITATDYKIDYEGKKEFLIDAPIFYGSSGSIIMLCALGSYVDKNGHVIYGSKFNLLGVLAGFHQQDYLHNVYWRNKNGEYEHAENLLTANTNNLGYCVKAECLKWFGEEIKRLRADDVTR